MWVMELQLVKKINNMMKWGYNMDEDNRTFLYSSFISYKNYRQMSSSEIEKNEKDYHNLDFIAKNIIKLYCAFSNVTDFSKVTEKFKYDYIEGESEIERNETREEKAGIGVIYDYICQFDPQKDKFNIFVEAMKIHSMLYSECVGKEFGGKIRTEQALLFDTDIEVMPPEEATKRFNAYILTSDSIMKELDQKNVFEYIEGCLKIVVDLITIQPFSDGNKRTFRSLFNIMMKRKNLPPIYIGNNSKEYSDSLIKAMRTGDYSDLTKLYTRLLCDSIVLLGLEEYEIENNKTK